MKSPAEYVAAARTEHPDAGPVPVITVAEAEVAVMLALADAERYKTNLVGAVLRSHPSTPQATEATSPHEL